jgi:hypothetical protein
MTDCRHKGTTIDGTCIACWRKRARSLENFVEKMAEAGCLRPRDEFRGECGRDGAPKEHWCFTCQAREL